MNTLVKNAIAARGVVVAKNVLTVEDQRANEEDKKKMRQIAAAQKAKGERLAADIVKYYDSLADACKEKRQLEGRVRSLMNENMALMKPYKYSKDKAWRLGEDAEARNIITKVAYKPDWMQEIRNVNYEAPGGVSLSF